MIVKEITLEDNSIIYEEGVLDDCSLYFIKNGKVSI